MSDIPIEEIYRRLKNRFNIEKDELEAIGFKTEEEVVGYYHEVAMRSKEVADEDTEDDGLTGAPTDNYKLSPAQQKELDAIRAAKQSQKSLRAAMAPLALPPPADLSHLPEEERVNLKDMKRAVAAVNEPDASEERPKLKPIKAKVNKPKKGAK